MLRRAQNAFDENVYTIYILHLIVYLFLVCTKVTLGRYMNLISWDIFIFCLFLSDQSFSFKGSHTTGSSRSDGLSVLFVLNITGGEDTFDACLGCSRDGQDITIFIEIKLRFDERSGWFVSDGVEETVDWEISGFFRLGVL